MRGCVNSSATIFTGSDCAKSTSNRQNLIKGKWSWKNGALHWVYSDGEKETNKALCAGKSGFALREADGSISLWIKLK